MRVVLLGQYPLDPQRLFGGPEAAMAYVLPELARLPDVELCVITCIEGLPEARRAEHHGVPITYLPRKRLGRITWHLREVRAMHAELGPFQPDIVHAHGAGLYAGAALTSRYPAVVTVHGIFGREARLLRGWRDRLRGVLDTTYERWVVRKADHLIAISPYVERVFAGSFHGHVHLVDNPCDEAFFELLRSPVRGRILLPGVVVPRKGVLPLLHALELLRANFPEAHLRIAGSTRSRPEYYQRCRAYVAEAGLVDSVSFLGHLEQRQVLEEYASCELMVLPSFQETAPIALEQGMAAGVPVVATATGGVPDMVRDGLTGWTLPAPMPPDGDPQALADVLSEVLGAPERAREVARRAQQEASERFRPVRVAQQTYQVYRQALAAPGVRVH